MALNGYVERYNFTVSDELIRRVQAACSVTAHLVSLEPGNTPGHSERADLMRSFLASPSTYAAPFAFAVMGDLGFDDESTDAGLQQAINTAWNVIAGV